MLCFDIFTKPALSLCMYFLLISWDWKERCFTIWFGNSWLWFLAFSCHSSGNHALILTSAAVEVVIPQAYMPHVYGENNGNLGHIRQVSRHVDFINSVPKVSTKYPMK